LKVEDKGYGTSMLGRIPKVNSKVGAFGPFGLAFTTLQSSVKDIHRTSKGVSLFWKLCVLDIQS
jgi:hypothetical protein